MQHKQEEADEVKRKLAEESRSDHIALLRAFEVQITCIPSILCTKLCTPTQGWEEACRQRNSRDYCWDHFLSHNTLEVQYMNPPTYSSLTCGD